jgi:hypothetical protein
MTVSIRRFAWAAIVSMAAHTPFAWWAARQSLPAPVERTLRRAPPLQLESVRFSPSGVPPLVQLPASVRLPRKARPKSQPFVTERAQAPPPAEDVPRAGPEPQLVPQAQPETGEAGEGAVAEEAQVRVAEGVAAGVAAARAEGGLVPAAYSLVAAALREATTQGPPVNGVAGALKAYGDGMTGGAQRYGATGAPYAEPPGRWAGGEVPSMVDDAAARGDAAALAVKARLVSAARLQEIADGRAAAEMFVLIELRHSVSGAVHEVKVLQPSGWAVFDQWAYDKAKVARLNHDGGVGPELRSVWRIDAVPTFRRALKEPGKPVDGKALLGGLLTNALVGLANGSAMVQMTGRVDPVTGQADMVDFTNPTYRCKVTLIRAY